VTGGLFSLLHLPRAKQLPGKDKMIKAIAKHFEIIYFMFFPALILTFILSKDVGVSTSLIWYGIVTTAFSVGVIAVFFEEKTRKAFAYKLISLLLLGAEIIIGVATYMSYTGHAYNDIPTWLGYLIATPPVLMFFLVMDTLQKVRKSKRAPEESINAHPYSVLSNNIQLNSHIDLPTYEIVSVLPIKNSEDKIVMLKYTGAFKNVLRCKPDGTIVWQAELPTKANDVYTNIERRDDYLLAYSRSCVLVKLDEKTGLILSA
jgi:hypothetical protein